LSTDLAAVVKPSRVVILSFVLIVAWLFEVNGIVPKVSSFRR